jgi:hypothetical protein
MQGRLCKANQCARAEVCEGLADADTGCEGSLDADTGRKGRPDADTAGCEGGRPGEGPVLKEVRGYRPKNGRVPSRYGWETYLLGVKCPQRGCPGPFLIVLLDVFILDDR